MKTFIGILVGCSLALSAGTAANQNSDKKAAPKTKSAPKQKAPRVHAAPHVNPTRTAPNAHMKVNRPPSTEKLTKSKTHENTVAKQQLRKAPTAPKAELPAVQSQKLATAQTNKKFTPLPKQSIERIQAQHRNFKARPNPAIASAQFNQNYQIAGAQNWTGPQYRVFAAYRPQWHDQSWWQSRYSASLLLIGGGWYYWDAGYWYPAWGYDQSAAYYPYDGPIYVGDNRTPFDQVVADVQATLQEQGYYRGDVDGLMGPLTRQALADFQRDNGLVTTAALDQPTLSTLGLG
jgi:Putative peptidoglycan binding domain